MPAKRPDISNLGVEKTLFWTVTAVTDIVKQLTPETEILMVDSVAACSVYLPPVGLMTGKTVSITNKTGTSTVTIYPFKEGATHAGAADSSLYDGTAAQASQQLAASAGAFAHYYCDGYKWIALAFDLSI